jgi:hypothetical protein
VADDSAVGYLLMRIRSLALAVCIANAGVAGISVAYASAASLPTIEGTSVSAITETEATLETQINPEGLETTYEVDLQFEVCQNEPPRSAHCWAMGGSQTTGSIAVGALPQTITVNWSDLEPDFSYRYWIVAANSAGKLVTEERTFTTRGESGELPTVVGEWVSGISEHQATLTALINPDGFDTAYEIWLERPGCDAMPGPAGCESTIKERVGQGQVTAVGGVQRAEAEPSALEPDCTCGYWVIATSVAGETTGPVEKFVTKAGPPPQVENPLPPTSPSLKQPAFTPEGPRTLGSSPSASGLPANRPAQSETTANSKLKVSTRARQLAKAMKACRKKPRRQRSTCERLAVKRFGVPHRHQH